jgi:hypothetical protein
VRGLAQQRMAVSDAVSALCSADYELACAVARLKDAEHPAADEAEALFEAALAFRQKIESEAL